MQPKTEKVVDPESIAWIEQRQDDRDDEEYFASAWRKALNEATSDLGAEGRGPLTDADGYDRTAPHRAWPPPAAEMFASRGGASGRLPGA